MEEQKIVHSLTKIVATLGPSSEDDATIRKLIKAGMSVARINCSHGNWEERTERINAVRRIAMEEQRAVGILVDLQGPKIRTGTLPDGGVPIEEDEKIILTTVEDDANYESTPKIVFIRNYPERPTDVSKGQRILLDDGLLRMRVDNISGTQVECSVIFGGILKSNKGVNLPESRQLNVQALTPKDREDLKEGVKIGADYIALSFVRQAADIVELRSLIDESKEEYEQTTPIKTIAKIEKPQALDCLDDIIDVVDAVMVARGDLGVELDPEKVPLAQKEIINKANHKKKIVITATQMMDSMINNPFPTRAEVSDVANAILDGTDAVMLSGETAAGKYPVEAVNQMRKVALEVESSGQIHVERLDLETVSGLTFKEIDNLAIAQAVYDFAQMKHVRSIVAFSCSGYSVRLISKLRPKARIIAATTYQHTYNHLSLVWGVTPVFFNKVEHTNKTFLNIENFMIDQGFVQPGETIVLTGGLPISARSSANFVKLHSCDGSIKDLMTVTQDQVAKDLGPMLAV